MAGRALFCAMFPVSSRLALPAIVGGVGLGPLGKYTQPRFLGPGPWTQIVALQ